MKNTKLLILINIILFIVAAIGISYFYISNHLLSNISEIESGSVIDIFLQIGCVGAVLPVISFTLIILSVKKITNKLVLLFTLLAVALLTIVALYFFIMYMTFHEFPTPVQFHKLGY